MYIHTDTFAYRTNFFYGPHIVYGANGKETDTPGRDAYNAFHKYTIEWYGILTIQLKKRTSYLQLSSGLPKKSNG